MVTSYIARVADHAAHRPDRVALVDDDGPLTYRELWDEVLAAAQGLADHGVAAGDVVAVWLPNGRAWIRSFLGISLLGATTLCVNTGFGSHEVAVLARRARPTVMVLAPRLRGRDVSDVVAGADPAALGSITAFVLEDVADPETSARLDALVARNPRPSVASPVAVHDASGAGAPAVVFTSSGTTGDPKLVVHTVHSLSGHVSAVASAYGMEHPDAAVLAPMPFCGVMGLETMLSGLVAGTTVTTMRSFDAHRAVDLVEQHEVTVTACSDEALRRILDAAGPDRVRSLRDAALAVFGGDAEALLARARAVGFRAFQTYGSSEVHALLCFPPPGVPDAELAVGGGYPVLGDYRARARRDGATLAHHEPGSLEIQSPYLFAGYLDSAGNLTRTLSADGWFATGDLGHSLDGGFAYLTRESDALRLGGYLVEPREIERFLEEMPGIGAAQVVGADDGGRTVAVAFILAASPADTAALDENLVIEGCRAHLAKFKVPAAVEWLDVFPVTDGPNGVKIRRNVLREQALEVLRARRTASTA